MFSKMWNWVKETVTGLWTATVENVTAAAKVVWAVTKAPFARALDGDLTGASRGLVAYAAVGAGAAMFTIGLPWLGGAALSAVASAYMFSGTLDYCRGWATEEARLAATTQVVVGIATGVLLAALTAPFGWALVVAPVTAAVCVKVVRDDRSVATVDRGARARAAAAATRLAAAAPGAAV